MLTETKFVKYSLEESDTIESVAQKFGISTRIVIDGHNINVEIKDKIKSEYDGFPKHITFIYIVEEVVKDFEKAKERKTGYVIWADPFYKPKVYGFLLESYENDTLINKIHYQVEMVYKKNEDKQIVLEVNQKQVYINNKQPDTIIEQLANSISETIFPIQLQISNKGEIVGIQNHKELLERWQTKKEALLDYYKGEIADKIIVKATNYFKNKHTLTESLTENWFFNLFFKPIYGSYSTQKEIKYNTNYPTTTTFEIIQNLGDVYSKTNKIMVTAKGNSINSKTINEATLQYKLNEQDKSIFSIIGSFTSNNKKTQVEIYQQ